MSRTIKFRVWDLDHKEFVYISQTEDGEMWVNNGVSTTVMPYHKCELEQYTGLFDRNGKEIYEGCELDGRYIVEYIAPKFCCKDMVNGDIVELYENRFTITREHCEVSQDSERGIN